MSNNTSLLCRRLGIAFCWAALSSQHLTSAGIGMNSLLGKSLNAARIHQKSAMMCSWSGFGSVGWVIMGWLEGSSFFCVKKQQSCSFGVSLFAFLMFSCKCWNFGDWNGLRMYGNRVRDGSVASDFECFLLERWLLILLFPKAVLESFRQWSHTLNEHTYPLIGVFSICSFGLYLAKTSPLMRYTFRMPRPTMTDTWCFPKVTGGRLLSGFIRYDLRQNLLALRMNFLRFWDGDDPPERVERCFIRAMWLGSPA